MVIPEDRATRGIPWQDFRVELIAWQDETWQHVRVTVSWLPIFRESRLKSKFKGVASFSFGGLTKKFYTMQTNCFVKQLPQFWISNDAECSVGVSTLKENEDTGKANSTLMKKIAPTRRVVQLDTSLVLSKWWTTLAPKMYDPPL